MGTQLIKLTNHFTFELLGQTIDDVVGEAFDKAAKIIGLPYPGGPLIDKYAKEGNTTKFKFPESKVSGFDYSFSGIKTSFLYFIQNNLQKDPDFVTKNLNGICASYQSHLIKVLLKQLIAVANSIGIKEIAIAGGVSANSELRKQMTELAVKHKWNLFIPKFEYCTDNAAMITITAYYKYSKKQFGNLEIIPKKIMSVEEN